MVVDDGLVDDEVVGVVVVLVDEELLLEGVVVELPSPESIGVD